MRMKVCLDVVFSSDQAKQLGFDLVGELIEPSLPVPPNARDVAKEGQGHGELVARCHEPVRCINEHLSLRCAVPAQIDLVVCRIQNVDHWFAISRRARTAQQG